MGNIKIERDMMGLKKKISYFENKNLEEIIITSIDVVKIEMYNEVQRLL